MASKKPRAWQDDDDTEYDAQTAPSFLKEILTKPSWAKTESSEDATAVTTNEEGVSVDVLKTSTKKLSKHGQEVQDLLTTTASLITSASQVRLAQRPSPVSTLHLPKDCANDLQWHRNGQLAVVGASKGLYIFHVSGKHAERVALFSGAPRGATAGRRTTSIFQALLPPVGDNVAVRQARSYFPSTINLLTGQVTPLRFLDVRESRSYRNSNTTMALRGERFDDYFEFIARPSGAATHARGGESAVRQNSFLGSDPLAVVNKNTILIGSLGTGSVAHRIYVSDEVQSCVFSTVADTELIVGCRSKIHVYDLRNTARILRTEMDKDVTDATCLAQSSSGALAIGSESGVVSLYSHAGIKGAERRVFDNLSTGISGVEFSGDGSAVCFWTKDTKNGLRLAIQSGGGSVADTKVVPAFPPVASRHQFIQAAAFNDAQQLISIAEREKIVNYAL